MSWVDAETSFGSKFEGYEPRLSQRALATAIELALDEDVHLLAQAPTGTGKSYAAQVPAIDFAFRHRQPVVLSTATKALQDQYVGDCEALQKLYKPFRFAVVKGRSNYVCLAKLDELSDNDLDVDRQELYAALKDPAHFGDFDQLPLQLTPFDRSKLSTSSEECPGKSDCPFGSVCLSERAKTRAADAQLIITNHALLVTDATLKGIAGRGEGVGTALLPDYGAVVVDEAHELEEYTTGTLGSKLTERSLTKIANDVADFLEDSAYINQAVEPIARLFGALEAQMPAGENGRPSRENSIPLSAEILSNVGDEILGVIEVLRIFEEKMAQKRIWGDDQESQKKKRLRRRNASLRLKLSNIIMADFADLVRWVERETVNPRRGEPYTQISLNFAPLSVAGFLRGHLWNHVPAVLMSATLSVGSDFSFLAERLGFEPTVRTFDCESPFDYETKARIYVPEIADPKKDPAGWRAGMTANLIELVKASDGRALLLFTSWTSLNSAYQSLGPVIESMGHRTLKQGERPNKQLAQIFADDEHSVLFAVKSFFTGVDFKGDALRLVVIDKCPFPVPSDVIFKARCDVIDAKAVRFKDKSFNKLSIPTMALTLLQGVGRLIRTTTDQGVIAILDPRVMDAFWGKSIRTALPPAPVTRKLSDVTDFLRSLDT